MNREAVIHDNLLRVQEKIAHAAHLARRDPNDIRLVGVCKYVDLADTASLIRSGCKLLGESRPQQLWEKTESPELTDLAPEWRLIGHLQRNKSARTVECADSIDSVDSRRLLTAIDSEAAQLNKRQRVLLEVNCSGDSAKHGFTPDELRRVVGEFDQWPNVQPTGLMTMAAREGGLAVARQNFAALRELLEEVADTAPAGVKLTELSMGMSGDFKEAIFEGSTLVRVGSALWEGLDK